MSSQNTHSCIHSNQHPTLQRVRFDRTCNTITEKIKIVSYYINRCAGHYFEPGAPNPTTKEAEDAIEWLERFFKIE